MGKFLRKAIPFRAEQFNGDPVSLPIQQNIAKQSLDDGASKPALLIHHMSGKFEIAHLGDYIAINDYGDIWIIDKNTFERDYEPFNG